MSIESFRKFIEKWGAWIFGFMVVAFSVSFVSTGQSCAAQNAPSILDSEPAIATIGGFKATAFEVNRLANSQAQNTTTFGPEQVAQAYVSATSNVIDHLYKLAFAAEKGVKLDDGAVKEAIPSLWAQQVQTFKDILTQQQKITPASTQAQFEAAFKEYSGRTLEEQRQYHTDQFNQQFADPGVKELMRSEVADHELRLQYAMQHNITDTELQNAFGSYKVLQLSVVEKPGMTDAKGTAEKALADIKGGLKFEDAITKYSNDSPIPGKKLTDPTDVNTFSLQYSPAHRPLLSMKEGDVSNVIEIGPGMYTIFKVLKFTPNVPADFAAKKDQTRKMMVSFATETALRKDTEAFQKAKPLEWKSPGYKAIYDYTQAMAEGIETRKSKLQQVQREAKQALESEKNFANIAALAYFISTKALYDQASDAEKKTLTADRIDSIEKVLLNTESADDRLKLVDLYLAGGRTEDAVAQLEKAAMANTGTNPQAVSNYEMILARYDKLSAQNKVPDPLKKSIQQAVSDWRRQVVEEQQFRINAQKEQERLEKENAAALAKQKAKEEADKKAAAAKAKADAKKAKTPIPTTAKPK